MCLNDMSTITIKRAKKLFEGLQVKRACHLKMVRQCLVSENVHEKQATRL